MKNLNLKHCDEVIFVMIFFLLSHTKSYNFNGHVIKIHN